MINRVRVWNLDHISWLIGTPNGDAKQGFSRLGDRSIYYIADGTTRKKTVLTRFSESAVTTSLLIINRLPSIHSSPDYTQTLPRPPAKVLDPQTVSLPQQMRPKFEYC